MSDSPNSSIDGVRLAVMSNRIEGVVRAMMNTLFRAGRSTVINTGRDFSCCILTAGNEIVAAAESIPIHVMAGPDRMAEVMQEFHPGLKPGDAFLHNSPYHGNSHAADFSILVPVIDAEGVHRYTVLSKAHMADCGNSTPTTYAATARDVYEEGALIFPCVQVQREYQDCDDILRICLERIRVPEQWHGDYLALVGSARIGERRMLELGAEVGWARLGEFVEDWFDYSELRMASALRTLPKGRFTGVSVHDPFPGVPDGVEVKVSVSVIPEEAHVEVDLTDNVDCQPCGLNLSEATARTSALVGVFNSIEPTIPKNAGSFRCVDIRLREGCIVGIPTRPHSCSAATTNLAHRVINAVQGALAEAQPGSGLAEAGYTLPPSTGVISGIDPRDRDKPFVTQLLLSAITGGAASAYADGWLTATNPGNGGATLRDSVEIDELRYPIRILCQHIIPDSEGAGKFRGAPGAYCEYGPIDTNLEVWWASNGTINPPKGVRAGLCGGAAGQFHRLASGELVVLDPCGSVVLRDGERIVSISNGGGGYGDPRERDPERVRHDVREGWISVHRAEALYGVICDDP